MIGCFVNLTLPSTNVGRVDLADRARYNEGALPKGANCRRPHLRSSAVFLCSERCEHGAVVAAVIPPPLENRGRVRVTGAAVYARPASEIAPPHPPHGAGAIPLTPKKETAAGWSVIRRPSSNRRQSLPFYVDHPLVVT